MSETRLPRDLSKAIRRCERILDNENASQSNHLAAVHEIAEIRKIQAKTAPLRSERAERSKELNLTRQDRDRLNGELADTKLRVSELEVSVSDLTKERDGLKADLSRLGDDLRSERQAKSIAESDVRKARKQTEGAEVNAAKLRFSLQALTSKLKVSEELLENLFIEFSEQLSSEVFTGLGWTPERFELWSRLYQAVKGMTHDDLIERLHRAECSPCRDEKQLKRLPDADDVFIRAFLRHCSVDVGREVAELVAQHREAWFKRNRASFGDPPLSQRHLTPLARTVRWGEN